MNDPRDPVQLDQPLQPPPPPAAPAPEVVEDAGSRALAEALRSSFVIVKVIMVLLAVLFLGSGLTTVGPQEKAVILRFGKPVGEGEDALLGPGFHWAWPPPIDEVVKIPISQVQTVQSTIGWYATTAAREATGAEPPPGTSLNPATDGYLLTADGNIIHARGTLRYRISEPGLRYEFDFVNASNLVQNAFNGALIYAAANYTVDDVLTRDAAGFREKVRRRLEQLIARDQLGVTVDLVEVQTIPPRQLKEAFAAALGAEVDRAKTLNDAKSYANQTLSRAEAEKAARISAGETERTRLVEFVAAEAKRFTDLLPAYRLNPALFMLQHQTEVLRRVKANAQETIILPQRAGGKAREVRIMLNREPPRPKTAEPPAAEEAH
jgi:membrane protease subunit HflK